MERGIRSVSSTEMLMSDERESRHEKDATPGSQAGGKPAAGGPRFFTLEELATYDGKAGRPCYVAYRGFVFDVTHSLLWKGGEHQQRHKAGRDLTREFAAAPHGTLVLSRVPIVGRIAPA